MALNYIGEAGQLKRKAYQRRLPENPNKDYYYILRETGNTEPILVEYGFIDNKKDAQKLENNLEEYVEGVVKALAEYTGYPYYPREENNNKEYYIVKKGDTLYSISRKYNIPVETLKQINNLTSNNISIGQKIYLINKEENGKYIVKKGDTLYSIATKNNTTVDEIKRINNLSSNTLYIGQELTIPGYKDEEETQNIEDYMIYTVEKGDSLWKISKEFDIPVNELIKINNLTDLTLQINQQLLVPNKKQETIEEDIYIVKKGDTLWSVARENNIDVETLKRINNLTTNLLTIGQKLKTK